MTQKIILKNGDPPVQITNGSQQAFVTFIQGSEFNIAHSESAPNPNDPHHVIRYKDIETINSLTITEGFSMWVWVNAPIIETTLAVSVV